LKKLQQVRKKKKKQKPKIPQNLPPFYELAFYSYKPQELSWKHSSSHENFSKCKMESPTSLNALLVDFVQKTKISELSNVNISAQEGMVDRKFLQTSISGFQLFCKAA